MEAYKIWASLNLKGDALEKMERFTRLTMKSSEAITKLSSKMAIMNKRFEALSRHSLDASPAFKALSASLAETSRRTDALTLKTDKLARALAKVKTAGSAAATGVEAEGVAADVSAHRRGGHVLTHAHLPGYAGMIARSTIKGGLVTAGAVTGISLGYNLVKTGFQQENLYQKNLAQLQARGLTPSQMREANAMAHQIRPGISSTSMLQAIKDARMATPNWKQTKMVAPYLAMGEYAIKSIFNRKMTDAQMRDAVKVAEFRANGDPNKLIAGLDMAFKMVNTSAASLMPTDLRTFFRIATNVSRSISDKAMLKLEPAMQELGASRTGTGFRTLTNELIGGIGMTNNKAAALQKVGLISGVKYDKTGRVVGTKYGAINPDMKNRLLTDPVSFEAKLEKMLKAQGITKLQDIQHFYSTAFPSTAANFLSTLAVNRAKEVAMAHNYDKLQGVYGMAGIAQKTLPGAQARTTAAWENFSKAIVDLTSPEVTKGLNILSSALEKLTGIINKFEGISFSAPRLASPSQQGKSFWDIFTHPIPGTKNISPWAAVINYLDSEKTKSNVLTPPNTIKKPIHVHVHIDGKKIAEVTTHYQEKAINRGGASSSSMAFNMLLTQPTTSYG